MLARRVAEEEGEALGGVVGYQIRMEGKVSDRTRIKYVTEGILLRWLQDAGLSLGELALDLVQGREQSQDDATVGAGYEAGLQALQPRFELYRKASRVNAHPWLADLVIWRARNSPRILRRMSGVLEETQNPGRLLSWRGIGKLLFE